MTTAAYRRHVPRQWLAHVTGERRGGHLRQWAGHWYVNARTAPEARREAIKRTRRIRKDFHHLRATVKLANS